MPLRSILSWCEVPVRDLDRAKHFYDDVFGWDMKIDETGPNPLAIFGNETQTVGGHIYPGEPAKGDGPTVHIAVPDRLEDAADRCQKAGGTMQSDPVEIPPGRFAYATDPDGNSIGLFEPKG